MYVACAMQAGDWKAVDILFTYHSVELLPHWYGVKYSRQTNNLQEMIIFVLCFVSRKYYGTYVFFCVFACVYRLAILSSIPETYAPFAYRTLLPEVG